jgi:hypothetical protein
MAALQFQVDQLVVDSLTEQIEPQVLHFGQFYVQPLRDRCTGQLVNGAPGWTLQQQL